MASGTSQQPQRQAVPVTKRAGKQWCSKLEWQVSNRSSTGSRRARVAERTVLLKRYGRALCRRMSTTARLAAVYPPAHAPAFSAPPEPPKPVSCNRPCLPAALRTCVLRTIAGVLSATHLVPPTQHALQGQSMFARHDPCQIAPAGSDRTTPQAESKIV